MTSGKSQQAQWYINVDGSTHGPLSFGQLRSLAQTGRISRDTPIIRDGMSVWMKAGDLRGLFPSAPSSGTVATLSSSKANGSPSSRDSVTESSRAPVVMSVVRRAIKSLRSADAKLRSIDGKAASRIAGSMHVLSQFALMVGVLSVLCCWARIGPIAILLGVVAIVGSRYGDSFEAKTRRHAIFSISLGIMSTCLFLYVDHTVEQAKTMTERPHLEEEQEERRQYNEFSEKRPYELAMTAMELAAAYARPMKASEMYKDRYVLLSGFVTQMGENGRRERVLILGDKDFPGGAQCNFGCDYLLDDIQYGDRVAIVGRVWEKDPATYSGNGVIVFVNDCYVSGILSNE